MAPFGPGAFVHVHRHSLISGIGGPFSLSVRNFPVPVGAPTGMVAPLAVGSGTLHEVTPLGTVNYTYDNAGRRSTMQVVGQTQVTYTWDNANRLSAISQGSQSVGLSYDNTNRRSCLSLPNGVIATY